MVHPIFHGPFFVNIFRRLIALHQLGKDLGSILFHNLQAVTKLYLAVANIHNNHAKMQITFRKTFKFRIVRQLTQSLTIWQALSFITFPSLVRSHSASSPESAGASSTAVPKTSPEHIEIPVPAIAGDEGTLQSFLSLRPQKDKSRLFWQVFDWMPGVLWVFVCPLDSVLE